MGAHRVGPDEARSSTPSTALQPRCVLFWDQAAWHMAFNASVAALRRPEAAARGAAHQGPARILEARRGLPACAASPTIPTCPRSTTGSAFSTGKNSRTTASPPRSTRSARSCPDAPAYAHRFAAYELAQCPGHEREAYELLLGPLQEGQGRASARRCSKWLGILQEKLNVPADQKVDIPPAPNP